MGIAEIFELGLYVKEAVDQHPSLPETKSRTLPQEFGRHLTREVATTSLAFLQSQCLRPSRMRALERTLDLEGWTIGFAMRVNRSPGDWPESRDHLYGKRIRQASGSHTQQFAKKSCHRTRRGFTLRLLCDACSPGFELTKRSKHP